MIQVLELVLVYAVTGFVTGSAFGALMSFAETGSSVPRLRAWQVALWGALGALVFPAASLVYGAFSGWIIPSVGFLLLNIGMMAAAGAGSAAGMVALARRADRLAPPPQPPLLP